jgi:hypothetical protein
MKARRISKTLAALFAALALGSAARGDQPGTARIAHWKDDSKAAFLLMFDDSWPSHWQVAVPALAARKMTATFYINPGKGEYLKFKDKWEKEVWTNGVVLGVHTMTHQGVKDVANAEYEIGECTRIVAATGSGKTPRLISWAMPGVGPGKWNISAEELQTLLKKHHLIDRPTFNGHGVVYHLQKTEQMLALADKAIASGGMEYLIAHGVERGPDMNWGYQDFWAWKQEIFHAVLDGLAQRRDRGELWIADHISYHQYVTERDTAKIATTQADARRMVLRLTCEADPVFYDHPLTIVCTVPAGWRTCRVTQGRTSSRVESNNGTVMFDALPGPTPIEISPIL